MPRCCEALGPEGVLINVGRGTVVDERGAVAALQKQEILTAGLDVFEDEPRVPKELIAMDHVVLLPHVGSASVHTRNAMGQLVVDNLKSVVLRQGPADAGGRNPMDRPRRLRLCAAARSRQRSRSRRDRRRRTIRRRSPGAWDLSLEGTNRKCRLTFGSEPAAPGQTLRFPAGCRRALPVLARRCRLACPGARRSCAFSGPAGETTLVVPPDGDDAFTAKTSRRRR